MSAIKKLSENQSRIVSKVLEIESSNQDTKKAVLVLQGLFLSIKAEREELEKRVRGLLACLKEEDRDCYELGREDKHFEDKVKKMCEPETLNI